MLCADFGEGALAVYSKHGAKRASTPTPCARWVFSAAVFTLTFDEIMLPPKDARPRHAQPRRVIERPDVSALRAFTDALSTFFKQRGTPVARPLPPQNIP